MRATVYSLRFSAAVLAAVLAVGAPVSASRAGPVPTLTQRVTDATGTLSASQRQQLESQLAAFEARKGAQVAVLIVATTSPESVEQYALRVVEAAKLGRKGIDDGALLLVAKQDRALRIEVGYGLEGVLPDAIAKRIIAEVITPFFKQGDYYGGIEAGVRRIMGVIEGEPLPAPSRASPSSRLSSRGGQGPALAVFGALAAGSVLRSLLGRVIGAVLGAGIVFVVLYIVSSSLVVAGVFAFFVFLMVLVGSARGSRTYGRRGGFGGMSYGGGFGGGGFSGGGFSGGGGGFGGGGASGRW